MSAERQRVRRAVQDAANCDTPYDVDDLVWDGDMLVPRDSPLDKETLDERAAHGMGHSWEERRRE